MNIFKRDYFAVQKGYESRADYSRHLEQNRQKKEINIKGSFLSTLKDFKNIEKLILKKKNTAKKNNFKYLFI